MITPNEILQFYKSSVTKDLMYLEDESDENTNLIQNLIDDSYKELEIVKDKIPNNTLDIYAKVLTLVAFLDRLGIDNGAFEGLYSRANSIRNFIFKAISDETIKATNIKKSFIKNADNMIITDDFIDKFNA